jgi:hypothetical protein
MVITQSRDDAEHHRWNEKLHDVGESLFLSPSGSQIMSPSTNRFSTQREPLRQLPRKCRHSNRALLITKRGTSATRNAKTTTNRQNDHTAHDERGTYYASSHTTQQKSKNTNRTLLRTSRWPNATRMRRPRPTGRIKQHVAPADDGNTKAGYYLVLVFQLLEQVVNLRVLDEWLFDANVVSIVQSCRDQDELIKNTAGDKKFTQTLCSTPSIALYLRTNTHLQLFPRVFV